MSKELGDIAELSFMHRAKIAGFTLLTPYSSDCAYDLAVEYNGKISKIQIKCTNVTHQNTVGKFYRIVCSKGSDSKKFYTSKEVDYFAFYIMPIQQFYIIPFKEINSKNIKLYPDKKDHKYSKYLENFALLK